MKVVMQRFISPDFWAITDQIHGVLELLVVQGNEVIFSSITHEPVTVAHGSYRGVIYYKQGKS